jgi:hypothetical protein
MNGFLLRDIKERLMSLKANLKYGAGVVFRAEPIHLTPLSQLPPMCLYRSLYTSATQHCACKPSLSECHSSSMMQITGMECTAYSTSRFASPAELLTLRFSPSFPGQLQKRDCQRASPTRTEMGREGCSSSSRAQYRREVETARRRSCGPSAGDP